VKEDTIIEASGLYKLYRSGTLQVEALRDVDMAVNRGEMDDPVEVLTLSKRSAYTEP